MRFCKFVARAGVWLACVGTASSVGADERNIERITPFLNIEQKRTGGATIHPNTYTRLEIIAVPPTGDAVAYKKRKLFPRLTIGKKYTFTVTLKSEVGRFNDTLPLFARDYESSRKVGETFARSINFDQFAFPYFLATTDSGGQVARFVITANMVETTSSEVTGLSLGAIREALNAVAPTSAVLTTLTKDSADKVAGKIDEQAGKLFGTSVAEEISFDIDLRTNTSFVVELSGPELELKSLNVDKQIGRWTVKLADPRPSIFAADTCADSQCSAATQSAYNRATANPAAVLEFKLVEQVGEIGTVKAYLKQQDWWSDTLHELKTDEQYGTF